MTMAPSSLGLYPMPWMTISAEPYGSRESAFEHCSAELVRLAFGVATASSPFGRTGQKQGGLDAVLGRSGSRIGVQAKLWQAPSQNSRPSARKKRLQGWFDEYFKSRIKKDLVRFILAVPWPSDAVAQEWADSVSTRKLAVEVWDASELDRRIAPYREVIFRYFGPQLAHETEVYNGKRLAGYLDHGEEFLGIVDLLSRAKELEAEGRHLAAALCFEERALTFSSLGLRAEAEKEQFKQARQLRKAGQPSSADKLELQIVAQHLDAGRHSDADEAKKHAWRHTKFTAPASDGAHLAAHVIESTARLTTNEEHLLGCVETATGEVEAWLCLLVAEVAFAAEERTALEAVAAKLMTFDKFDDAGLEMRRQAIFVDAGLASWTAPADENEGAAEQAGFSYSRQGYRLQNGIDLHSAVENLTESIDAYRSSSTLYLRASNFTNAASAWRTMIGLQGRFGLVGDNDAWQRQHNALRSLYSQPMLESRADRLQAAAADAFVDRDPKSVRRAIAKSNAAARIAAVEGKPEHYRGALELSARAALELEDVEEALRFSLLAGDRDSAIRAAKTAHRVNVDPSLLEPNGIQRRKAVVAALGAAASTWSPSEARTFVDPLCDLLPLKVSGLQRQFTDDTLRALSLLTPCLASSGPLLKKLKTLDWRRSFNRDEERAATELFYWLTLGLTDRQLGTDFDAFLCASGIKADIVEPAVTARLARLPQDRRRLAIKFEAAERPDLAMLVRERERPTPKEANAALDRVLRSRRDEHPTVRSHRFAPSPSGLMVERWTRKDAQRAIQHLLFVADGPNEMAGSRVSFLSAASHIARWKVLSIGVTQDLTDDAFGLLRHAATVDESQAFIFDRPDEIPYAVLEFAVAIHPIAKPSDPRIETALLEMVLSGDDNEHTRAGLLLSELFHKQVAAIDESLLAHHQSESIRTRAALTALLTGNTQLIEGLARDSNYRVRRALATHISQLRSLGTPGSRIIAALENDVDARVRTIVSTAVAQCDQHA